MAASAWSVFSYAKGKIGNNTINLSNDTFAITLHRTSASANLNGDISIFSSVASEISATGGYTDLALTGVSWAASGSGYKWDVTDPVFTASGASLNNVRFAVIRSNVGASVGVGSGHLLCYAPLSTAQFAVSTGNTLTIQMAGGGVFNLV